MLGLLLCFMLVAFGGCSERENYDFSQLEGKVFAVPTGTVADQLVLSRFPNARFQYYNTVLIAAWL